MNEKIADLKQIYTSGPENELLENFPQILENIKLLTGYNEYLQFKQTQWYVQPDFSQETRAISKEIDFWQNFKPEKYAKSLELQQKIN